MNNLPNQPLLEVTLIVRLRPGDGDPRPEDWKAATKMSDVLAEHLLALSRVGFLPASNTNHEARRSSTRQELRDEVRFELSL